MQYQGIQGWNGQNGADRGILFMTLHTAKNVVVNVVAKPLTAQEPGH